MRSITLNLDDNIAHRLEVLAAKDDMRLPEAIENLLTHIVEKYEAKRRD